MTSYIFSAAIGEFKRKSIAIAARGALGAILCGWVLTAAASAASLELDAGFTFSGTSPAGTAPWLTATFDDGGSTGSVDFLLTAVDLSGDEGVKDFYLNLDPALNVNDLTFSLVNATGGFDLPSISLGEGAFKADGDGHYDIEMSFTPGSGTDTFSSGDSLEYTIGGISTLDAASFQFLSTGSSTGYVMAAHVQNTGVGGGSSGWVTDASGGTFDPFGPGNPVPPPGTPEPSTFVLAGFGLAGLFIWRCRRQQSERT